MAKLRDSGVGMTPEAKAAKDRGPQAWQEHLALQRSRDDRVEQEAGDAIMAQRMADADGLSALDEDTDDQVAADEDLARSLQAELDDSQDQDELSIAADKVIVPGPGPKAIGRSLPAMPTEEEADNSDWEDSEDGDSEAGEDDQEQEAPKPLDLDNGQTPEALFTEKLEEKKADQDPQFRTKVGYWMAIMYEWKDKIAAKVASGVPFRSLDWNEYPFTKGYFSLFVNTDQELAIDVVLTGFAASTQKILGRSDVKVSDIRQLDEVGEQHSKRGVYASTPQENRDGHLVQSRYVGSGTGQYGVHGRVTTYKPKKFRNFRKERVRRLDHANYHGHAGLVRRHTTQGDYRLLADFDYPFDAREWVCLAETMGILVLDTYDAWRPDNKNGWDPPVVRDVVRKAHDAQAQSTHVDERLNFALPVKQGAKDSRPRFCLNCTTLRNGKSKWHSAFAATKMGHICENCYQYQWKHGKPRPTRYQDRLEIAQQSAITAQSRSVKNQCWYCGVLATKPAKMNAFMLCTQLGVYLCSIHYSYVYKNGRLPYLGPPPGHALACEAPGCGKTLSTAKSAWSWLEGKFLYCSPCAHKVDKTITNWNPRKGQPGVPLSTGRSIWTLQPDSTDAYMKRFGCGLPINSIAEILADMASANPQIVPLGQVTTAQASVSTEVPSTTPGKRKRAPKTPKAKGSKKAPTGTSGRASTRSNKSSVIVISSDSEFAGSEIVQDSDLDAPPPPPVRRSKKPKAPARPVSDSDDSIVRPNTRSRFPTLMSPSLGASKGPDPKRSRTRTPIGL